MDIPEEELLQMCELQYPGIIKDFVENVLQDPGIYNEKAKMYAAMWIKANAESASSSDEENIG